MEPRAFHWFARCVVTAYIAIAAGCCIPSSEPMFDRASSVGAGVDGLVVLVDQRRGLATCTGAVLTNDQAPSGFVARVVTVRHCVHKNVPYGIAIPPPGAKESSRLLTALPATVEYIATGPDRKMVRSAAGLEWDNEDWAILRVESPSPLHPLPVGAADPATVLSRGDRVRLATYYDGPSDEMKADQLEFNWQGTPGALVRGGNSGAPILRDGRLFALFSGAAMESTSRCARPTRLTLVNIQAVLAAAEVQGFNRRALRSD